MNDRILDKRAKAEERAGKATPDRDIFSEHEAPAPAEAPLLFTVQLETALQETAFNPPPGTKRLTARLENPEIALRVAYTPGGTEDTILEIPKGCTYEVRGEIPSGLTVYFLAEKAPSALQIKVWT